MDLDRRALFVVSQVAPYPDGPAGVHGVLPQATAALVELAGLAGLRPRPVADVAELDAAELAAGGVLALFTIGETPWSGPQRAAIADGVRGGRLGIAGIHSATDSCREWADYATLLGARFDGHPWTQAFTAEVGEPGHPAVAHLGRGWEWYDEVYLFRDLRPNARVLLRVADGQLDLDRPGARLPDIGLPLSWCFTEGAGRVFYTALGHFPAAWESPVYLRHVLGGLSWLVGTDGD